MRESPKNVLFIDDHVTALRRLKYNLSHAGFPGAHEAGCPETAVWFLQGGHTDLIIVDDNMLGGPTEFFNRVRANKQTSSIPFLFLIFEMNGRTAKAAKAAGVTLLQKPFENEDLRAAILSATTKSNGHALETDDRLERLGELFPKASARMLRDAMSILTAEKRDLANATLQRDGELIVARND